VMACLPIPFAPSLATPGNVSRRLYRFAAASRHRVPSPGVEPGPRPSGVACPPSHSKGATGADGRTRTGMDLLTKQGPHHSATAAARRGARSRTLSASFGGSQLSQEHTPENGPPCPIGGIVVHPPALGEGVSGD